MNAAIKKVNLQGMMGEAAEAVPNLHDLVTAQEDPRRGGRGLEVF